MKYAVSVQIRGIAILFVLKWAGEIEFQLQRENLKKKSTIWIYEIVIL